MGADVAAVSIVSVFWVVVGAIVPWFIRKGSHRSLIQAMIVTTSICCYLFWLCTYMSQMYPLVGPSLSNSTVIIMEEYWGSNKSTAWRRSSVWWQTRSTCKDMLCKCLVYMSRPLVIVVFSNTVPTTTVNVLSAKSGICSADDSSSHFYVNLLLKQFLMFAANIVNVLE